MTSLVYRELHMPSVNPLEETACIAIGIATEMSGTPIVPPRRSMEVLAKEVVADARWFPLRFDIQRDEFHFALIEPERHREIAFLHEVQPQSANSHIVGRRELRGLSIDPSPLHLILHSGLGGSTLLARALSQSGSIATLQEPPILTDVIAYGLRNSAAAMRQLLSEVTQLLSRPFQTGEVIACKVSAIGNGLGTEMARNDARSQILCLQSPLEEMLSSFAARGLEGRMAARKLLLGIRNSRMIAFELTDKELGGYTDLQLAALGWLWMQKVMLQATADLGPSRVASITSEQLMQDPYKALSLVAQHFRAKLDVEQRIASGVFQRHAKTGEPFDAERRAERVAERLRLHSNEIEPIVSWARKIAENLGIVWELPYPLLT